VEECDEELESYREDEKILAVEMLCCPSCGADVVLREGTLKLWEGASLKAGEIAELLEVLGAASVSEALAEVRRQISLYEKHRERRAAIDEIKQDLLPISNAPELYRQLVARERAHVEIDVLDAQLARAQAHLERLEDAARESGVEQWGAHEREVADLTRQLQNAELHKLRAKESAIRREYESALADLDARAQQCASRQRGLARASSILAETEQQYLQGMMDHFVTEINRLLVEVFARGAAPQVEMAIEATAAGARKLRVTFNRDFTYEMFSGGEKARINLCVLLVLARLQNYKLLLLDEFSRYLDAETARVVLAALRRNFAGTIIAVEHARPHLDETETYQEIQLK
jgi:hypothetical protein